MYEVFCGPKEAMESIARNGAVALNPKSMKWQIISNEAKYEVREDYTVYDEEGLPHICATLLCNLDLGNIAKEKELII